MADKTITEKAISGLKGMAKNVLNKNTSKSKSKKARTAPNKSDNTPLSTPQTSMPTPHVFSPKGTTFGFDNSDYARNVKDIVSRISFRGEYNDLGKDTLSDLDEETRDLIDVSDESDDINANFQTLSSQISILGTFAVKIDQKVENLAGNVRNAIADVASETSRQQVHMVNLVSKKMDEYNANYDQLKGKVESHDRQIDELYSDLKRRVQEEKTRSYFNRNKRNSVEPSAATDSSEKKDDNSGIGGLAKEAVDYLVENPGTAAAGYAGYRALKSGAKALGRGAGRAAAGAGRAVKGGAGLLNKGMAKGGATAGRAAGTALEKLGAKGAAKLGTKLGARLIPGLGWVLLGYDAYEGYSKDGLSGAAKNVATLGLYEALKSDDDPKKAGPPSSDEFNVNTIADITITSQKVITLESKQKIVLKGASIILDSDDIQIKGNVKEFKGTPSTDPDKETPGVLDPIKKKISDFFSSTKPMAAAPSGGIVTRGGGISQSGIGGFNFGGTTSPVGVRRSGGGSYSGNDNFISPGLTHAKGILSKYLPASDNVSDPFRAHKRESLAAGFDALPPEKQAFIYRALQAEGNVPKNLEQLSNYSEARGISMDQAIHSGFFGPVNRGAVSSKPLTAAEQKNWDSAIKNWRGGSNIIGDRTDQGMPGDPNYALEHASDKYRPMGAFADHPMFNNYRKTGKSWFQNRKEEEAKFKKDNPNLYGPKKSITPGIDRLRRMTNFQKSGGFGKYPSGMLGPIDPNDPIGSLKNTKRKESMNDPTFDMFKVNGKSPFNYAISKRGQQELGTIGDTRNLTQIDLGDGVKVTANKFVAKDMEGMLREFQARGYKFNKDTGGYALRKNVNAPSMWSTHATGATADVNPGNNPNKSTSTDIPPNAKFVMMKYGYAQLHDDKMHIERVPPEFRTEYTKRLLQQGIIKRDDPIIQQRIAEGLLDQKTVDSISPTPILKREPYGPPRPENLPMPMKARSMTAFSGIEEAKKAREEIGPGKISDRHKDFIRKINITQDLAKSKKTKPAAATQKTLDRVKAYNRHKNTEVKSQPVDASKEVAKPVETNKNEKPVDKQPATTQSNGSERAKTDAYSMPASSTSDNSADSIPPSPGSDGSGSYQNCLI